MSTEFPRIIDASLIEIGDKISVIHKLSNGITMTMQGTVAERTDQGQTREYRTAEGGVLASWEPGKRSVRVVLLSRAPARQTPLWEVPGDVEQRVS